MWNATVSATPTPTAQPLTGRIEAPLSGLAAALRSAGIEGRRRRVHAGEAIYRAGQPFQHAWYLQAGSVKTTITAADGRERVTGFHLRGELLGMEALGQSSHSCDAVALEDGEVWEIPCTDLLAACARHAALARGLAASLAAEIRSGRGWMLASGTLAATPRVAALLLELGRRQAELGYSACRLVLRMTRAEIGSLLSLTLETVTRALTQLRSMGLIEVERRDIVLKDPEALSALIAAPVRLH